MASMISGKPPFSIESLESYNRILNIPIVCSGLSIAGTIYIRVKKTNNLLTWTLEQAEDTIKAVTKNPAIQLLETPLSTIDRVICKSLDVVENKIPSINLPPKMIYWNTKEYITDATTKIVKPVLKRADSMKHIGNSVLSSKYTEYAADKLDDALYVADAYIEKYLPDQEDQNYTKYDENDSSTTNAAGTKARHTIHHADRVSRKLQRRLTKRTLEHAKIIKDQSTEAIHVLLYVAELIVTDPKLALQKTKELWMELSKDEPENQARPKNVEELFVLLMRELARKLVHFINYSKVKMQRIPKCVEGRTRQTSIVITEAVETIIKKFNINLEEVRTFISDAVDVQIQIMMFILQELSSFASKVLEKARQPEPQQSNMSLYVPRIDTNSKAANSKGNNNSNFYNNSVNDDEIDQHDCNDHHQHVENGNHYSHHTDEPPTEDL